MNDGGREVAPPIVIPLYFSRRPDHTADAIARVLTHDGVAIIGICYDARSEQFMAFVQCDSAGAAEEARQLALVTQ